ncbi:DUF1289 domain-containing protein [Methylocystis echinoides]|uniref:DUF1289 domain-containing protein n=1 Tax=Methylocystis echinoides TaxID=29468 RepID=A0A9W6GR07_9HYPH|nr:DUF1289 domain-containing protein [Methylocystis echinoides]GLI91306.1 DUF1289 domain-containing protein [Methylocystis echinoides]
MVESPCNKICTLNAAHICIGCGRSRAEIGGWSQMSDGDKKRVVARAKERLAAMGGARKATESR